MQSMIKFLLVLAIGAVTTNAQAVDGVSNSHAQSDVEDAATLGIDAFTLNVGNPSADYTYNTLSQLFETASSSSFKLFFSMDLAQQPNLSQFVNVVNTYLGHPAYYRSGANNRPFLSTFNANNHTPSEFSNFKSQLSQQVYFVPDFDDSPNYYSNSPSWFSTWNSVIDGAFS
ncbi:glycoside hydrolase family 71 protein [Zasmidium cellare ATCC 36951]|uniref:Glycoside hydrolase family 71 protein n=1 Tax=Zasmidium cellare ATCC 36951 TaxID=1080233 RepID=A0A6A6CY94_ZASCE|nr:glycoside hydrolase family 71 protein [Zasmidium cellare ATCC 36951]KAF2170852.1 glycoside hydrolase family 71 protein [Zasmidium cellare ATCC 36951]